ncbi:MAG: hypothetical protein RIS29_776 [Bacteroidota bacterium]
MLTILLLSACGGGSTDTTVATLPTVTTTTVSNIAATTATAGGNVTADGDATVTTRGVCWSTSENPTTSSSKATSGSGTGSFSCSVADLSANTTYYLRAFATNSVGTSYGDQVSFTTTSPTAPVVTTTAASSVASTTATSGGNVTSDGGSTVTAKGICWSTSTGPTIALSTKTTDGTDTGSFTSSITGLTLGLTYYVRAYATNAIGTSYGSEVTFTTTDATAGTMTASVSTSTYSGQYAPRHVMAVWVVNSSGTFIKSLNVYGNNYTSYLTNWKSASSSNKTDATTGATLTSHASVSCSWNGKNVSGTVVPDGTYKLCVEFTEANSSGKYAVYSFTKGSTASTGGTAVTSSSYISLGSLSWAP